MVFTQLKQAFDSAVVKINNFFAFGKKKIEVGEAFKDKLLKIAHMIIELLEDIEEEVEESQEEVEDILEE